MSLHRNLSLRRRIILSEKPVENRPCFMDHESDQDSSLHDVSSDYECISSSSSPVNSTERYEDNSAEFLDLDIPLRSPDTPWISRRLGHNRNSEKLFGSHRISPIPFTLYENIPFSEISQPRNCNLVNYNCDPTPVSPPHRKLRALRLFDTPHTPKTLLEKSKKRLSSKGKRNRQKSSQSYDVSQDRLLANTNPFTPDNNTSVVGHKRTRSDYDRRILDESTEEELDDEMPLVKKIALHEINTSRYNEEFLEVCKLGDGEFGSVYKCVHRLDGCTYAIKKSKTPVAGSVYERNAMNEVYAHAVLGKHRHVVRYYSAWAENDYMFIQNEYCNGGSLADVINENGRSGFRFSHDDVKQILFQCAKGLRYIHSMNLVHLDIKPGNIFIHREPLYSSESGLESSDEDVDRAALVTYKIGDLGHVTSVNNPVVEEGDCRYLPKEILEENYEHLYKADIFSLGLTIYKIASGEELPKNGALWHELRDGQLPYLPQQSIELNALLKSMVLPDSRQRPTAAQLTHDILLCPQSKRTKAQLQKELNEERFKNEILLRKLTEATKVLAGYASPTLDNTRSPINTRSRNKVNSGRRNLIGRNMIRSMSSSAL